VSRKIFPGDLVVFGDKARWCPSWRYNRPGCSTIYIFSPIFGFVIESGVKNNHWVTGGETLIRVMTQKNSLFYVQPERVTLANDIKI